MILPPVSIVISSNLSIYYISAHSKSKFKLFVFPLVFLNVILKSSRNPDQRSSCMNLKEIEYIVTLCRRREPFRAAQRLLSLLSALTQRGQQSGARDRSSAFERSLKRSGSHQGRSDILLSSARQILQIRQETDRRLGICPTPQKGNLSIGVTSGTWNHNLTHIYPGLSQTVSGSDHQYLRGQMYAPNSR